MKKHLAVLITAIIALTLTVSAENGKSTLKTQEEKVSYCIGTDVGKNFKKMALDINPAMVEQGTGDKLAGKKTILTDEELKTVIEDFKKEMRFKRIGKKFESQNKFEGCELKTKKERLSYAIGMDIGKNLKRQDIKINTKIYGKGIKDAYEGAESALSEEEILSTMQKFQTAMQKKQAESSKKLAEKNIKEGKEFLAKNKKKDGVVTLENGLQYQIIKAGTGASPKATDTVTTHYRGTLIDGTEFDSSYKRNQPASFPLNRVIPGWTQALQLMKVGSKWKLFIPSELAYGPRGAGRGMIPPNATLIFEIELIGINGK